MARDYKAEYQRRIDRLMSQGFSRSQARGHPKTIKETKVVRGKERTVKKAEPSVKETRQALSEDKVNVSELATRYGGRYIGTDNLGRKSVQFTDLNNRTALNNAIAFAKTLPRGTSLQITMYGYQIKAKHSKPGKPSDTVNDNTWNALTQLTTPGRVVRQEGDARKRYMNYYSDKEPAEFYVIWYKS